MVAGSFLVTTTGVPTPLITRGGVALPSGLSFADNGNGTGLFPGARQPLGRRAPTPSASRGTTALPECQSALCAHGEPGRARSGGTEHHQRSLDDVHYRHARYLHGDDDRQPHAVPNPGWRHPALRRQLHRQQQRHRYAVGHTRGRYRRHIRDRLLRDERCFSDATQNFTLTVSAPVVQTAPQITSVNATTFTTGTPGSFTVTTTGSPTPSITRGGVILPSGVSFTDNGNGTGMLAGTPAVGTQGTYAISFTAANTVNPPAMQNFTLTVNAPAAQPPLLSKTFTLTAASNPFPVVGKGITLPTYAVGGTAILSFTLTNPNPAKALSGVGFSDPLPAGLLVASPNALTNTCGGTVTAVSLSASVALANGTLAAGSSCSISINTGDCRRH